MRILSVILFFAFSPMYLSAQPSSAKPKTPETFGPYYNQIGADLLPAIITGGGGELGHYQIEALYREHQPSGDLRIKIEINNKNYFEGFTPYPDQLLPGSTLENQRYQQNEIVPRASILVSLGRSTYRYSQRLPIYLGADAQAGVIFTERITFINDRAEFGLLTPHTTTVSTSNHRHILAGVTPFIGTNIPITKRLSFTVEFGLPIIYHTGTSSYVNEHGARFDTDITEFNLFDSRPINDLAIFYRL